uniref:Uncharacterized protein n=1 Tax=Arundo donax TaxID=35708 RepID=A0A0A9ALS4_ARUDO
MPIKKGQSKRFFKGSYPSGVSKRELSSDHQVDVS